MSHGQRNNFDFVRLVGAGLVLYGHSFAFLGLREPRFLSWLALGPLGVYVFFTISGYLVAQSHARDPRLLPFLAKRSLRIFPGLAVCVVLSIVALGPALTSLPLVDYFRSTATLRYLENITLYITYGLPGVFTKGPFSGAVNGSLWSLPVEFFMYLLVAAVGLARGGRWAYLALAVAWAIVTVMWAMRTPDMLVIYRTDVRQVFFCGIYFWVGAVIQSFNLARFFSLSATVLAGAALLCVTRWPTWLPLAAWVLLPVIVLGFGTAHSPVLGRLTSTGDYSYGIYIYAFPIQQTVLSFRPDIDITSYVAICAVLTLICAVASWHLVERPALALKRAVSAPAGETAGIPAGADSRTVHPRPERMEM